ncbi:hypothetical protein LCGC14_0367540 [marine sediment metagenome]|uniref:Uncharacterized protein n=1 Tax=marine sediment metagenome TaxID=412755 RepID=A0A0F9WEV0_9ZZZZ
MNKDIEDALEALHSQLSTNRKELMAISAQYFAQDKDLTDSIEKIEAGIGDIIRDIERLVPG